MLTLKYFQINTTTAENTEYQLEVLYCACVSWDVLQSGWKSSFTNQFSFLGSQEVNSIQLSMNKKNRWQMTDNLIEEVNIPDCMIIISHHHLKPGQHRRTADCMQVCSQKNGKTLLRDAKSTYARADNLCDHAEDRYMEDDAEAQQMLTKRQRRRRKWYQKVQEQDEDEELLIHCKVYTAPSKHHFQIQPPRGNLASL